MQKMIEYTRRPGLAYEEWRTAITSACAQFDPDFVEPDVFMGWAYSRNICNFAATDVGSNVPKVERTYRHTKLDSIDLYSVVFQLTGKSVVAQHDDVVHGLNGLTIADGSVMPRAMAGNTMAPCVIIGERASAVLKAEFRL